MQYVDLMEKNTKQMLQLVNQILDFRKIQNGKMRLHVSLFNLNEMVDSFEKEFRVMAEENEVSFTFQLAGEDIMVWADKEKVAIVIRNIISNAFKFTPAGGNIYVTMGVSDDDKHCYVRVEDSGVGIPQSKLSEIFERFSQADNARGAYYQGTGIGLALSKEIISLHHGEIYAESPEGKGAVFTIELQLGKEHYKPSEVDFYMGGETVSVPETESVSASAGKESEEEKEQPVDSSLPTVLIVEDNKDLCNMLKLQLEDKFNIYMANDGVEGLKKVHLYHPDMVVTDQMMPNMDGIEMLQRIRKGEQVVAIVAPSILGQFSTTIEQVYGAFRQIGFTDIIEVAQGAMSTVEHEAHELIEKLEEGQKFMTTSCCPSYIELVNKYIPDMKKYVSGTGSPMYYAARIAKEKYPDAKIVFVGPCVAKRKEAQRDEAVDFVMTFEEVSSIFDAFEVNLEIVQPYAMEFSSVREAHGFAQAGGVMGAVKAFLKMEADKINAIQVSDLNKKNIGTLRAYAKSGKAPGQFIEVMACRGVASRTVCTQ